jgi:site-specific DNA-methyltransferase (adenine-specific)
MKPGGTILVFAGTRTYDLMTMSLRLAGFEIKDTLMWLYGSGFPKAYDIAKGIESKIKQGSANWSDWKKLDGEKYTQKTGPEAKLWSGWKSHGLKPAYEPILVAMKPNEGSYAENALKYGVAGLNIDGGRIGYQSKIDKEQINKDRGVISSKGKKGNIYELGMSGQHSQPPSPQGRFPANIILECICDEVIEEPTEIVNGKRKGGIWKTGGKETQMRIYKGGAIIHTNPECPCYMLDKQSGVLKSGKVKENHKKHGISGFIIKKLYH